MAKWSDETYRLQTEAGEAIDKMLRSMHADRMTRGDYQDLDDRAREQMDLSAQGMSSFVVVGQYQSFEDIDLTNEIMGFDRASTSATLRGLLVNAARTI